MSFVPHETLHDAGLDWITITAKGSNANTEELLAVFHELQRRAIEYGEVEKSQCWNTFSGMATDHLFFGRNAWGVMFRASSGTAREAAREIVARGVKGNVTRLDCQATTRTPVGVRQYIAECLADVERFSGGAEAIPLRELQTTKKTDGASGFRVGSPNSARRGVVYDKTAEQRYRVETSLARFEARFGGIEGRALWEQLENSRDQDATATAAAASYFKSVGIQRPWMDGLPNLKLPSSYKRVDSERRLDYLYSVVRTMCDKLRDDGFGYELDEWWRCARWGELPDLDYERMRKHFDDAT